VDFCQKFRAQPAPLALAEGAAWLLFCVSGVEIVRWRERAGYRPVEPSL
jgi:hypothetical protein